MIRIETNEIQNRKYRKINKTKSQLFENTNDFDKPLTRLAKKKRREKIQITRIRSERGDITTDHASITRIIKENSEQFYLNKLQNLDEIEKFLERSK